MNNILIETFNNVHDARSYCNKMHETGYDLINMFRVKDNDGNGKPLLAVCLQKRIEKPNYFSKLFDYII